MACPLLFPIGHPIAKLSYPHGSKQNPWSIPTSPNPVRNRKQPSMDRPFPHSPQILQTRFSSSLCPGWPCNLPKYAPLLCVRQWIRFCQTPGRKSNIFMVLILPPRLILNYQHNVPQHGFRKKWPPSEVGINTSWLQCIAAQVILSNTMEEIFSNVHLVDKKTEAQRVYINCWRSQS